MKAQARRIFRSDEGAVRRDCEGSERGKEIALETSESAGDDSDSDDEESDANS